MQQSGDQRADGVHGQSPCVSNVPLSPGWRNEFHAGPGAGVRKYLVLDGEYIWKYTHKAYDFSVLGDSPITFPIEWDRSKIPGYAFRVSVPNWHGFTAFVVMSHVAARFFEPQVSGIGATPVGVGSVSHRPRREFQRDHSPAIPALEERAVVRLQLALRQRPGGRSGAVRGRQLREWAQWNGFEVDVSGLTPDQQFQAGLYCGSVHATPPRPSVRMGLCPASQYGSNLVKIPAAGTENDDHNPPRIAPQSVRCSVGHRQPLSRR
jgi:hypothetical protein